MGELNCLQCRYRNKDNGNCTATGGFCTAVPAAHCHLLQEYLNTGLTPESCQNAKTIIDSAFADDTSKAERIRELLKADKEGRVLVLPCKLGDTVYVNDAKRTIRANIDEAYLDDDKGIEYLVSFVCDCDCNGCPFSSWHPDQEGEYSCDNEWGQMSIMGTDFGKTVFHSRAEAENALEGTAYSGTD